jgi:phosphohistidine phosphatase SixA
MKLFIMRHGDAVKPVVAYANRPLTEKGKFEAAAAGVFLKMTGEIPDVIMHSSQLRGRMTAECLALSLGASFTENAERAENAKKFLALLAPRDDLEEDSPPEEFLASVVSEFGKTDKTILAIGHIPFVERLASLLLASRLTLTDTFGTCDLMAFNAAGGGRTWTLRFYMPSKRLRKFYRSYLDTRAMKARDNRGDTGQSAE